MMYDALSSVEPTKKLCFEKYSELFEKAPNKQNIKRSHIYLNKAIIWL